MEKYKEINGNGYTLLGTTICQICYSIRKWKGQWACGVSGGWTT